MTYEEALAWLSGARSMTNLIPQPPFDTWAVRIAQADAAMTEQAYWIARAHKENIALAVQRVIEQEREGAMAKVRELEDTILRVEQLRGLL